MSDHNQFDLFISETIQESLSQPPSQLAAGLVSRVETDMRHKERRRFFHRAITGLTTAAAVLLVVWVAYPYVLQPTDGTIGADNLPPQSYMMETTIQPDTPEMARFAIEDGDTNPKQGDHAAEPADILNDSAELSEAGTGDSPLATAAAPQAATEVRPLFWLVSAKVPEILSDFPHMITSAGTRIHVPQSRMKEIIAELNESGYFTRDYTPEAVSGKENVILLYPN